jgi:hypothetical protein
MNLHVIKTQSEYNKAEEDYQLEQKKFAQFQQDFEKRVAELLKEFQSLDENRLSAIRYAIERYVNLMEKTAARVYKNQDGLFKVGRRTITPISFSSFLSLVYLLRSPSLLVIQETVPFSKILHRFLFTKVGQVHQ